MPSTRVAVMWGNQRELPSKLCIYDFYKCKHPWKQRFSQIHKTVVHPGSTVVTYDVFAFFFGSVDAWQIQWNQQERTGHHSACLAAPVLDRDGYPRSLGTGPCNCRRLCRRPLGLKCLQGAPKFFTKSLRFLEKIKLQNSTGPGEGWIDWWHHK